MNEDEKKHYDFMKGSINKVFNIKLTAGFLLILTGGIAAFNILEVIIDILKKPGESTFFQYISNLLPDGIIFKTNDGFFSVSELPMSFLAAIILIMLGSSIALKFINAGINLLKVDEKNLLQKLWEEWGEIRKEKKEEKLLKEEQRKKGYY